MVDVTSIQQTSPNPASTVKGPNQTLGQDQFLALLIAQLKNQDPLNPVDSAEFIAQLAQFSQLEQAKQMTTALNTFIQRQDIANNNGLVSLIGHPVSALGSSFSLIPDSPVPLSYILAGDAANVTIQVLNAAGVPVRTVSAPGQTAGPQTLRWDGKDTTGNMQPSGPYSFTVSATDRNGDAVTSTTLANGVVTGLRFDNGSPMVVLDTGQVIPPSQILAVK
jgi:flagellar basal-body rod modification protein FlgD